MIMSKRTSTKSNNFLGTITNIANKRTFERQIRCEECAQCTLEILDFIITGIPNEKQKKNEDILRLLLQKIDGFRALPRFTLKVYNKTLDHLAGALEKATVENKEAIPAIHNDFSEAIIKMCTNACQAFKQNHYLLFCRIAEPIFIIQDRYRDLIKLIAIGPDETALGALSELNDALKNLKDEISSNPYFTETLRRLPGDFAKPRLKRIWSAGSGEMHNPHVGKFSIVDYSHQYMRIYIRNTLHIRSSYKAFVNFNYSDMPFLIIMQINEDRTDKIRHEISASKTRSLIKDFNIEHVYIMQFSIINNTSPLTGNDYYFDSMCRDLIETREWDANLFEEFAGNFWERPPSILCE